jgi:3-hydroxyacyl-[acyl-carrier-protein] dehydratase
MRWYWIDRFLEFESGRRAKAVKLVSLAEEHLQDVCAGVPVMPSSLIIEGIAQTGGLLVFEHTQFAEYPILAKIPSACFLGEAFPGDTLTYTTTIEYVKEEGAMVSATCHNGNRLQAEMEIMYSHFTLAGEAQSRFHAETFLDMMRLLGAFEVGRTADGKPLPGLPLHIELAASEDATEEERRPPRVVPR